MALQLQPTLSEMVGEVLAGLNLGVQGEENADLHPLIKRMLRQAQAYLWNHYRWLQNNVSVSIDLVEDVTDYDIPDTFQPGSIRRIYVRADGDIVREWDLVAGISPADRTAAGVTSTSQYNPFKFDIIDHIIKVHPAPGADPGTLHLEMDTSMSPLLEDEERPAVNGEACIQLATIYVKEQRRMPVGQMERDTHLAYVMDLRPKQSTGAPFSYGTGYIHPCDTVVQPGRRRYYDDLDTWRG